MGHAFIIYMPQDGHWLASFEFIPPSQKSEFFAAKKYEDSPLKTQTVVSDPKVCKVVNRFGFGLIG